MYLRGERKIASGFKNEVNALKIHLLGSLKVCDKNMFLTHDSYFKGALNFSRSNLGNQQGDLQ